jgi:hypothetical protein
MIIAHRYTHRLGLSYVEYYGSFDIGFDLTTCLLYQEKKKALFGAQHHKSLGYDGTACFQSGFVRGAHCGLLGSGEWQLATHRYDTLGGTLCRLSSFLEVFFPSFFSFFFPFASGSEGASVHGLGMGEIGNGHQTLLAWD